jgi:AcrR family transcriptional regulator
VAGSEERPVVAKDNAPPKTRDRILAKSLEMFNAQGEPNVTTNHIADELEISPGNLYYHFRNKDDIIEQLFARFEERIGDALLVPEGRTPNLEDLWLQMHLVFECIWDYRFIYRDLVDLLTRSRKLKMHFSRILKRAHESISRVCTEMVRGGVMLASQREIEAVSQNIVVLTTFWLNFQQIRPATTTGKQDIDLGRGIYQVLVLLAPYLKAAERAHLNRLADQYIHS